MFYSYTFCWLMSDGSGAIGDAWEILGMSKAWLSWFVRSESAADPGWHVGTSGAGTGAQTGGVVVADERASVLVVLLPGRAVLGTGGVAVSPVVTTVALEK
jgi:hypothetical protein